MVVPSELGLLAIAILPRGGNGDRYFDIGGTMQVEAFVLGGRSEEWRRTFAADIGNPDIQSREIYVSPLFFGAEQDVLGMAIADGVDLYQHKGRALVPHSWALEKFAQDALSLNEFVRVARDMISEM